MAVTQQFVRLAQATLNDVDLTRLRATPAADRLDLDWAGPLLLKVLPGSRALERVVCGKIAEHDADSYSDATCLSATDVSFASRALDEVDFEAVLSLVPNDEVALREVLGTSQLPDAPKDYLRKYFEVLRAFVHEAAERELAIVTWSE